MNSPSGSGIGTRFVSPVNYGGSYGYGGGCGGQQCAYGRKRRSDAADSGDSLIMKFLFPEESVGSLKNEHLDKTD